MKILYYTWRSFMKRGIEDAFRELGIDYDVLEYEQTDWEKDDRFAEMVRKQLNKTAYDAVFSVNFAPIVSAECEAKGIRYVAWAYDSPLHIVNLESMKNSCSEIYMFDRGQVEAYRKKGVPMKYLPLAADVTNFQKIISTRNAKIPRCDVSLLGKMYHTEYTQYFVKLKDYCQGYLEGIVRSHMKIYGDNLIPQLVTDDLLERMNRDYAETLPGFTMGRRELEFLLAGEVTGRERLVALTLLAKHFDTWLYSPNEVEAPGLHYGGTVPYYGDMPLVFARSRINLNVTLKSIHTGIPLRIFDVMACGGFVMTNYQTEVLEYFEPGAELEVYENLEDLYSKTAFYLEHGDLRAQIARRGLERVKRDFTFTERIRQMLIERI